jgi:predicted outer membrane repeat protein
MYSLSGSPVLTAVIFEGNQADDGGGLYNREASPQVISATFAGNQTSDAGSGGGMYNSAGSSPLLRDVTFRNNTAGCGGGMHNGEASHPSLIGVILAGNAANYVGGGIQNDDGSNPVLTNVLLSGNAARGHGGGLYNNNGSAPYLVNVTIAGNLAEEGGGIYNRGYNEPSNPTIQNTILWGNRSRSGGDQIQNLNSTPLIAFSDVQHSGGSGPGWDTALGTDRGGNLDADPRFVAFLDAEFAPTTGGDLRLDAGPAMDAGDDELIPAGVVADLDGRPRVVNRAVDMGAYELQPGLYLYKTASRDWVSTGDLVTCTLRATNSYTGTTMTGSVISDSLPSGLALDGPIVLEPAGAGTVVPGLPILVEDLTLEPGQSVTVTLRVAVSKEAPAGSITNTASVRSAQVSMPQRASHVLQVCRHHSTVTSEADDGRPGSLRQAIANTCPGGIIDFALPTPVTISLHAGQLTIHKSLTVTGPGPDLLAITANQNSRVIQVRRLSRQARIKVSLSGLTLRDGFLESESGGGLWNDADLSLTSVTLEENWAYGAGGGLYSVGDGHLSLTTVVFHKNATGWWGGGLENWNASATLTDVVFWDNSSVWGNGGGMRNGSPLVTLNRVAFHGNVADDYGGGMDNLLSSPILADVEFIENRARYGGGLGNEYSSHPVLTDVSFERNYAEMYGGGLFDTGGSGSTQTRVVYRSNRADDRGGGMCAGSSFTLTHVVFEDNVARTSGGGIYVRRDGTLKEVDFRGNLAEYAGGGGMYNAGSPVLADVTFDSNVAGYGGGMSNMDGGRATLVNVAFRGNEATGGWNHGGGMYNYASSPTLVNVTFGGNRAQAGGGALCNWASSNPTLTHTTFSGNAALYGGAIHNAEASAPLVQNSILWGNRAASGGDQIYNEASTPTLTYCAVEGSGGSGPGWQAGLGLDGGGNDDADPRFLAPVDATTAPTVVMNLRLRSGSPAIDAGSNSLLPPGVDTDLAGKPRVVNGRVDLGAYEAQGWFRLYLPQVCHQAEP